MIDPRKFPSAGSLRNRDAPTPPPEKAYALSQAFLSAGLLSPRRPGAGAVHEREPPLDFLGSAGSPFEFQGSYEISNGIRRRGGRGTTPLLVFTLEGRG